MDELSTLLDSAARLGVTERHVRRLVAERRIPYVKVGRFVRFHPADVAAWITSARVLPRSMSQAGRILAFEESRPNDAGSDSRPRGASSTSIGRGAER